MNDKKYGAGNITVLEGLEAVRVRPAMYIGDPQFAILQMLKEALDNAVDEHSTGHGNIIKIKITDTYISVEDFGRGIPVDMHEIGVPAVEVIMTRLHAGGKFDDKNYKFSGGLHGVGISVTNALSEHLEVIVNRDNKKYKMCFSKGKVIENLHIIGESHETGTTVRFEPDETIVGGWPTFEEVKEYLEKVAFLNENLRLELEMNNENVDFYSPNGIVDLLHKSHKGLHAPFVVKTDQVNMAAYWTDASSDCFIPFTNGIEQRDGTHVTGAKNAITKAIKEMLEETGNKKNIVSSDFYPGLYVVLAIKLQNTSFASQTKEKLVSPEARKLVDDAVYKCLKQWMEFNPEIWKAIYRRILLSASKRQVVDTDSIIRVDEKTMVFRLKDCYGNIDPSLRELIIVEGESAGGTAKTTVDKQRVAVFSLRGKVLNSLRADVGNLLNNPEIRGLIAAIGTQIFENFNIENLRYHKIIIMTDADADGQHIFALLIAFFVKFLPELILAGNIYLSLSPLFKVTIGHGVNQKKHYLLDQNALNEFLLNRFCQHFNLDDSMKEQITLAEKFCPNLSLISLDNKLIAQHLLGTNILPVVNDKLQIKSIYGVRLYDIPNIDVENMKYPIIINNNTIKDPFTLLEFFESFNKQVYIQRYKGLGEMNADELFNTCIDPENRRIIQLQLPKEDKDTVFNQIMEILGDENDRRPFVLDNLKSMFNFQTDE